MRSSARVAWRVAGAVAFVATATLAVASSRGAPLAASLVSAHHGFPGHESSATRHENSAARHGSSAARHGPAPAPCAASRLRIWISGGGPTPRYAVRFTNLSPTACTLTGYPSVSAYGAHGAQVGNAAGQDGSVAVSRVVLAPGASANASLAVSADIFPARHCHPVTADGLRVVPPGESASTYVRSSLTACSAAGWDAPVFLDVRPVRAG